MKYIQACIAAATILVIGTAQAAPVQLISNGDFETGSFSSWGVANAGSGGFYIDTPGTTTPQYAYNTAANPAGGNFYAVSAQTGGGSHSLRQSFTVAPGASSVILSFQMFANNQAGTTYIGNSLSQSGGANQHARVDILTAGAGYFDLGAAVLQNLFLGSDLYSNNPNPYTNYSFDITSLVGDGGTFQIRFAEVDNQLYFHQGVDNVSVLADYATENSVPEPATLALLGLALAGAGLARRRG